MVCDQVEDAGLLTIGDYVTEKWANIKWERKTFQLAQEQIDNISGKYYTCGNFNNHAIQYRYRNKINFVTVVTENNFVVQEKIWVVNSRVIRHICTNRIAFTSMKHRHTNLMVCSCFQHKWDIDAH